MMPTLQTKTVFVLAAIALAKALICFVIETPATL